MDNEKLNNSQRINRHLVCSQEVYDIIVKDCAREYVEHHPEMQGAKISQNHILKQISQFYLNQG